MRQILIDRLKDIEKEKNITILYAAESGSRAWGFESTDSDYDVRFIYRHQKEKYLSIFKFKDTIDYPVDELLDYSGWDLAKSIKLFHGNNMAIYEWLNSPIVYYQNDQFIKAMGEHQEEFFNPQKACYHYLGAAKTTSIKHLQKEEINVKKIFYALRPILAVLWILKYRKMPPVYFPDMLIIDLLSEEIINSIKALIERKKDLTEHDSIDGVHTLLDFINRQLEELPKSCSKLKVDLVANQKADELFMRILEDTE